MRDQGRSEAVRFIPACAGNTTNGTGGTSATTVHPRVCGEHGGGRRGPQRGPGSSPRVRGTRRRRPVPAVETRFIPACAGNTADERVRNPPQPVHPRVCGEHPARTTGHRHCSGSSPRVRGTPEWRQLPHPCPRFIPACAGNTLLPVLCADPRAVHPRVCGEHREAVHPQPPLFGSSPRVRGTPMSSASSPRCMRFIPACAGNTSSMRCFSRARAVHPRVCGEHSAACCSRAASLGSSPRVRGTPWLPEFDAVDVRFIPACAGNTPVPPPAWPLPAVHPRVCGEHYIGL